MILAKPASVKKRLSKSATVPTTAIELASVSLQDLPERTPETWSLRESISLLLDPITVALERGYDYDEISAILTRSGVSITMSSLKRYLAVARRKGAEPARRKRRSQSTATPDAVQPEGDDAATPTKRRRTTTPSTSTRTPSTRTRRSKRNPEG